MDERRRVDDFPEIACINNAQAPPVHDAGDGLRIAQVRVHARSGRQEPGADHGSGFFGITRLLGKAVHQRQVQAVAGHGLEVVGIERAAVRLGVALAIALDVGQPIGRVGVGPPVRAHAHVVVFTARGRSKRLMDHTAQGGHQGFGGPLLQGLVGGHNGGVGHHNFLLRLRQGLGLYRP